MLADKKMEQKTFDLRRQGDVMKLNFKWLDIAQAVFDSGGRGLRFATLFALALMLYGERVKAVERNPVTASPVAQVQAKLGGGTIAAAQADALVLAVKQAIAANPAGAAAILSEALAVKRDDQEAIAGRLVGAAIEGLCPQAGAAMVTALVRIAVELHPDAIVSIVNAATKAAPASMYRLIVATAIATKNHMGPEAVAELLAGSNDLSAELDPSLDVVGELFQALEITGGGLTIPPIAPTISPTNASRANSRRGGTISPTPSPASL
ncbi:MAG: hypothetical protein ACFUZC_12585 [Chthoniobacteraceae bacterium]